jgi:hypothetical protein
MPLAWYAFLLLIAGVCALGDVVLRGPFSLRKFALTTLLAAIGAMLGWALSRGLSLPDLFQVRVGGASFPIVWTFIGSVTFLGTLDFVERRARRKAQVSRPMSEILAEVTAAPAAERVEAGASAP